MAITGAALVLFVTFHCLMNSVAILWPTAYNVICEFLGANWYALIASAGLGALVVIHVIYAIWLTLQNRAARGTNRYAVTARPKTVEWSSQNMLVLGIVVVCFFALHLVQFWSKMQLVDACGAEGEYPGAAGTLFLSLAFEQWWTPVVYIIAFVALWFHMTHGFWSMFQSIGWDNTAWIPRLRTLGCWWATIVCLLFVAQAGMFTYRAMDGYYFSNPELKNQYAEMISNTLPEEYYSANFDELSELVSQKLGEASDPDATTNICPVALEKLQVAQGWIDAINAGGSQECCATECNADNNTVNE